MPVRDRRIRLHIQNDPLSPNDAVTPPRFAKGARATPELRRRLQVTFGVDPPALEEGLREAEILMVAHFDPRGLNERAPRLKWIQSTSAGVEKMVPLLPPDVVLTNASGTYRLVIPPEQVDVHAFHALAQLGPYFALYQVATWVSCAYSFSCCD